VAKADAGPSKVFRDPVHGLIAFEGDDRDLLLALVGTPEFQRLRRIRLLGLSHFVFPGAEHSRFVHSLGVYHVAKRLAEALDHSDTLFPDARDELREHRSEVLVAALLHDVGHGPFSHVLEKELRPDPLPPNAPRSHEEWTVRIIGDRIAYKCSLPAPMVDGVVSLIAKGRDVSPLARDLVSSQLDADRLDYLLRDSHATGVAYGRFDLDWLIHSIRVSKAALAGLEGLSPCLCVAKRKGRYVVEQYIQARQSMYQQVYMHRVTRAYEALLRNALRLARRMLRNDEPLPGCTPAVVAKAIAGREVLSTSEYLRLDEWMLWRALSDWAEDGAERSGAAGQLARMAQWLVERRRPYRSVELAGPEHLVAAGKVEGALAATSGAARFAFYVDQYEDAPYRDTRYSGGADPEELNVRPIRMVDESGGIERAEDVSDLVRALAVSSMGVQTAYYDPNEPAIVELMHEHGLLEPQKQGDHR